ncbi:MAG TPA: putative metal-dependent hydrolase [Bacteroidia bacterium]|jgi:hypothetical protein
MNLEQLKYPIGKYQKPAAVTKELLEQYIKTISELPGKLRNATEKLNDVQLDTPYREGGWTVRQVVHHLADSHLNSFVRFKLALTEDKPTIKPYEEALWAELPDAKSAPINSSLMMIEGIHTRWVILMRALNADQFKSTFVHPEHGRTMALDEVAALYAWHCEHHLAHITGLKKRNNWN